MLPTLQLLQKSFAFQPRKTRFLPFPFGLCRVLSFFLMLFMFGLPITSQALLVETLPNYKIIDKDLLSRDNLALVNRQQIGFQYQTVFSQGKQYRLGEFVKANDMGKDGQANNVNSLAVSPKYVVLHDSEDAAFDSGLQAVAKNGGKLLVLENNEKRNLYDFATQQLTDSDPNRMFWQLNKTLVTDEQSSLAGNTATNTATKLVENPFQSQDIQRNEKTQPLAKTTKVNDNAEFANYLLEQLGVNNKAQSNYLSLDHPLLLVALHNNRARGSFGLDYIDEFGNTQIACQHDPETKNLFWIATAAQSQTAATQAGNQRSQALTQQLCQTDGINVVTENAPTIADGDGSLSIYMANHKPTWQYVNIEIKAGKAGNAADETRAKNEQLRYIQRLKDVFATLD